MKTFVDTVNSVEIETVQAVSRWYACYTRPRNEKIVWNRMQQAGIECYLPLQRTRRRWSDRMKWVDEPLLKSYIFVKITSSDFIKVLQVYGLVRFVTFESKAVPIPENQIDVIKMLLDKDVELEVTGERLKPGQAVEVQAGPLLGLRGELVQYRGSQKVLVRLGEIGQGLLVTIGAEYLLKVVGK